VADRGVADRWQADLGAPGLFLSPRTIAVDVTIRPEVVQESRDWIAGSPAAEVGGKYVGRIHGSFDRTGPDWLPALQSGIRLEVIHHLDAGPEAERTATYHRPDGHYQERVFRAIEARHADVRHLGSWHSHHPNGLGTLSQGDVLGYARDVNSANHSHDLFLASLATDDRGLGAARHFLFVRGQDEYFEIDPRSITVAGGGDNPYAPVVDSCRGRIAPAASRESRVQGWTIVEWCRRCLAAVLRRARTAEAGGAAERDGHDRGDVFVSDGSPASAGPASSVGLPGWTGSKGGQAALARDRAWISSDHPELSLVNRRGTLLWTGSFRHGEMSMTVTLAYPDDYPASSPMVDVTGKMDLLEVSVQAILRPERDGGPYRTQLFLLLRSVARISTAKTAT
jgi:hypothetical protein